MSVEFRRFEVGTAAESDLVACHALRVAVAMVDLVEDPLPSYEAVIGRLRMPPLADGECLYWAAYSGGRMVGMVRVALRTGVNSGIADLEVVVHPEYRRSGVAVGLVRAAMPAVVASARGVVLGVAIRAGSGGARFAERLGLRVTIRAVVQRLEVAGVDRTRWEVDVAAGYRLEQWSGWAPENLVESYASARQGIADAPTGPGAFREQASWTVPGIRDAERTLATQGVDERVVVAVEIRSGEVVGLTRLLRYPYRLDSAFQNDTAVLAGHRGHGLGLAMKAAMVRWISAGWPELTSVTTTVAAENRPMTEVNLALGYRPVRDVAWFEAGVAQVVEALEDW